uniref:C-type lectin domain-containing protein n=1 Tax=Panagrolaimus superbus TaxID=310955 RepID=A0A914Z8J8_9BILA
MGGGSAWTWTDSTPFNFADWTNDEPDSGKQCIVASTSDGYWSTEACSKGRPFICSISAAGNQPSTRPPSKTTTKPTVIINHPSTRPLPTVTTPKPSHQYRNCSFGWVYFEPTHSCYGYNNKGIMMNWTSAETFCNSQSAHLASIHSYEEQMFINEFGLVTWKSFWLGLYSIDLGETWKWTDGSPFDYSYWYQGQPPQIYSGQNCVLLESSMTTSGFQSSPCTYKWFPICKKPFY